MKANSFVIVLLGLTVLLPAKASYAGKLTVTVHSLDGFQITSTRFPNPVDHRVTMRIRQGGTGEVGGQVAFLIGSARVQQAVITNGVLEFEIPDDSEQLISRNKVVTLEFERGGARTASVLDVMPLTAKDPAGNEIRQLIQVVVRQPTEMPCVQTIYCQCSNPCARPSKKKKNCCCW